MKDNQTPQKEDITNRRTKDSRLKKPQKIVKKSLNGLFPPVSEDVSSNTTKDSADFSPASESSELDSASLEAFSLSDISPVSKISQNSELVSSPAAALSALSETSTVCYHTPISKIGTGYDKLDNVSMEPRKFHKLDGSVEVDIVSNFLKQARNQVLNSNDVDQRYKKLLDALVTFALEECCSLSEERDCYSELVSAKFRVVFLCFLLWSFLVSVIFFGVRLDSSYSGFSPT